MTSFLRAALCAAAFIGVAATAPAQAASLVLCSNDPNNAQNLDLTNGCLVNNGQMFLGNDLYGPSGDKEANVETAIFAATGNMIDITQFGGDASGNGGIFGVTGIPGKSGTWDLTDDSVLIKYITVKGGNNQYSLFELLGAGANSGTWSTMGITVGNNDNQPNVSHIRFWTAESQAAVPEPGTWMLLLVGFFGIGAVLRRRETDGMLKAA